MACYEKDENAGLELLKFLFPVNISCATTAIMFGSQLKLSDAPFVDQLMLGIGRFRILEWS